LRKVPSDESDRIEPEAMSPTSENVWMMKNGRSIDVSVLTPMLAKVFDEMRW